MYPHYCISILSQFPQQDVQAKAADESVAEDGWGLLERQQGENMSRCPAIMRNILYIYICIHVYCCYMLYIYIHSVYVLNDILYVRHNILFVYYIYIHTICSFSMLYTLFTVYR